MSDNWPRYESNTNGYSIDQAVEYILYNRMSYSDQDPDQEYFGFEEEEGEEFEEDFHEHRFPD